MVALDESVLVEMVSRGIWRMKEDDKGRGRSSLNKGRTKGLRQTDDGEGPPQDAVGRSRSQVYLSVRTKIEQQVRWNSEVTNILGIESPTLSSQILSSHPEWGGVKSRSKLPALSSHLT